MSTTLHNLRGTLAIRAARRRGVTAVLAMMYLMLFSAMGVGFYAAFTLASQTAYNEREARRALAAAESGMEFARLHLWSLNISHSSDPADLLDRVETGLAAALNGSKNLSGGTVTRTDNMILVPGSATQYVTINDTGDHFRLEIAMEGAQLVVTSIGRSAGGASAAGRGVKLRYAMVQKPSSIFNFGVASRGPVILDSNAAITGTPDPSHGSILSTSTAATPVQLLGNSSISGDVSLAGNGNVQVSGGASIAGSKNGAIQAEHIHKNVTEPEFPTIDTEMFKKFATNVVSTPNVKYDSGTVKNLYIKANVNPTFSSSVKVQGVIYIEMPNKVLFDSNAEITGIIVTDNDPNADTTKNTIDITSNVKLRSVDYLPATADFPAELRALTGSSILAPGFKLRFDSNFGGQRGSIVGSEIAFDSNATGTIEGSVINLGTKPVSINSNGALTISNPGDGWAPAGMFFGSRYIPLPGSYEEIVVAPAAVPAPVPAEPAPPTTPETI